VQAGAGLEAKTRSARRFASALAIASAVLLGSASAASAAQRFAADTSSDTVGACSSLAPCTIEHAVNDAAAGDEVIVLPGAYGVVGSLSADVPIAVHGVAGRPRPQLIGSDSRTGALLSLDAGGFLSHLILDGGNSAADTLAIEGSGAEDLVVRSSGGTGVELRGHGAATMLRDSVVRVTGSSTAIQTKDAKPSGPVKILNVTAVATGEGSTGIKAKQTLASTTVRNTIVRGGDDDVRANPKALVTVDHSNLRPNASGYVDGGGNQSADPYFLDWAAGNLHQAAGSPAIDAGSALDPDLGPRDANSLPRVIGVAPDIGAYEFGGLYTDDTDPVKPTARPGSGTGTGGSAPDDGGPHGADDNGGEDSHGLAPAAEPTLGQTVTLGTASGTVLVRTPGGSFVPLTADANVPLNSTIDATHGVVALTSARDASGTTQTGRFWAGRFKVSQSRSGDRRTVLTLAGGSFKSCVRSRSAAKTLHSSGRRHRVRRLWGSDSHGRFRTRGRRGQATVRGTKWLTEDRCSGTLFKVARGAISVRDKAKRRSVLLHAGERYLARAAR
jgi:hypothetical protein